MSSNLMLYILLANETEENFIQYNALQSAHKSQPQSIATEGMGHPKETGQPLPLQLYQMIGVHFSLDKPHRISPEKTSCGQWWPVVALIFCNNRPAPGESQFSSVYAPISIQFAVIFRLSINLTRVHLQPFWKAIDLCQSGSYEIMVFAKLSCKSMLLELS